MKKSEEEKIIEKVIQLCKQSKHEEIIKLLENTKK